MKSDTNIDIISDWFRMNLMNFTHGELGVKLIIHDGRITRTEWLVVDKTISRE